MNKTDYEIKLKEQLNEIKSSLSEKTRELDELNKTINDINTVDAYKMYCQEVQELENGLDENARHKVNQTRQLEKRKSKCKLYGIAALVIYFFAAFAVLYLKKISFSTDNLIPLAIVALVGIVFSAICTAVAKKPISNKLAALYSDTDIIEYRKNVSKLFKKVQDKENRLKELKSKKQSVLNDISELHNEEKKIFNALDELNFNFLYKNTILFYGAERNNRYSLYLDGHPYDTVRGKRIIQINLSPGIHSFKVENTSYNIDGSVIFCYTFSTQQIIVGEEPEAFAFVCDYKWLNRVSGAEFEKKTKTKLI